PNKTDMLFEFWLATARSCLPSPLKSPTANERGAVPAPKLVAAKVMGLHVAGVVTVSMNVFCVGSPPLSNAVTVTVNVPAGCASGRVPSVALEPVPAEPQAENPGVLPLASVAVAVTAAPAEVALASIALIVALPLASVLTVVEPRKRLRSPLPEASQAALAKNS